MTDMLHLKDMKEMLNLKRFMVALHYGEDEVGYLTYIETLTENGKQLIDRVAVVLPSMEYVDRVKEFLSKEITIQHATGLNSYKELTFLPLESVSNLKLALTRLWDATGVQVDWSRPIENSDGTLMEG